MGSATLDPMTNKAVEAALCNNWKEAINLNSLLLEKYPDDVETLNRLARAYFECGKISKAKSLYKFALKLDPYNSIASKNFNKLSKINKFVSREIEIKSDGQPQNDSPSANLFLEEPGRTKIVKLKAFNSSKIFAELRTADPLLLKSKYNTVDVYSKTGHKIGTVDPLWSKRIAKALRAGAKFEAFVISVDATQDYQVTIFIKVVDSANFLNGQSIFPIERTGDFKPYVSEEAVSLITSDEIVHEDEEVLASSKETQQSSSHTSLESLAEKEQAAYEDLDEEN